jgi:hypothetical protein
MPQTRPDLLVGDTVDVKLHSAVVVTTDPLVVQMGTDDDVETVTVPAGTAGVVDIDVVSPLNWPPLAGDVWVGGSGKKWFGVNVMVAGELKVRFVGEDSTNPLNPGTVKATDRPLTLGYRTA